MTIDADSLRERVAALKHDLGKYVAWQSVNLDQSVWTGPVTDTLIDALRADILATKKATDGPRPAWVVWDEHAQDLAAPWDPPELGAVADAVQVLRDAELALRERDLAAIGERRAAIRQAQLSIRKALSVAHRTLLRRAEEAE